MIINRVRAIPNKWTFQIPPIANLLARYVGDGKGWIDPFAGETSPAETTNDLNPERPTQYHLDAIDFLKTFPTATIDGVLIDPPYSPRQVADCYKGFGREVTSVDTQGRPLMLVRNEVARVLKPEGLAICFGWNSAGIGKSFGFEMIEILLICHSVIVNDTIVTVERKIQARLPPERIRREGKW